MSRSTMIYMLKRPRKQTGKRDDLRLVPWWQWPTWVLRGYVRIPASLARSIIVLCYKSD